MSITPEKIEDLWQTLSRARIFGPWNVNDEIAALLVALPALLTEISDLQSRLSSAGSTLIEAIGAEGPENADVTAGRAVERIRRLEWLINDHIKTWGICDSADDDGESLVCGSDQCSYCALVLAVGGRARHE